MTADKSESFDDLANKVTDVYTKGKSDAFGGLNGILLLFDSARTTSYGVYPNSHPKTTVTYNISSTHNLNASSTITLSTSMLSLAYYKQTFNTNSDYYTEHTSVTVPTTTVKLDGSEYTIGSYTRRLYYRTGYSTGTGGSNITISVKATPNNLYIYYTETYGNYDSCNPTSAGLNCSHIFIKE